MADEDRAGHTPTGPPGQETIFLVDGEIVHGRPPGMTDEQFAAADQLFADAFAEMDARRLDSEAAGEAPH